MSRTLQTDVACCSTGGIDATTDSAAGRTRVAEAADRYRLPEQIA